MKAHKKAHTETVPLALYGGGLSRSLSRSLFSRTHSFHSGHYLERACASPSLDPHFSTCWRPVWSVLKRVQRIRTFKKVHRSFFLSSGRMCVICLLKGLANCYKLPSARRTFVRAIDRSAPTFTVWYGLYRREERETTSSRVWTLPRCAGG